MSGWSAHPAHPSIVTREHWIANQIYRWMPSVDVVHVHPGLFAFTYLIGLPAIVHLGLLAAPFGDGRNAPPSNKDIARVAAGVLADPAPHIGKSYRPTGPQLLSPGEIAGILTEVTGRKVRYLATSFDMVVKAARSLGLNDFEVAQMRYYCEELQRGAFELGAPTEHIALVTGREPEPFETIARRYLAESSSVDPRLSIRTKLGAALWMLRMMVARVPNYDRWERDRGHPVLSDPLLAPDSQDRRRAAEDRQLHLLADAAREDGAHREPAVA